MKKQTAVEWLVEQFEESHSYINEIFKETIEQAKAMEIDQTEEAFHESRLTKDFCVYLSSGFKHESFYAYYYEGGDK
jgi:hypothetical protein